MNIAVGEKIKELRKELNMSQEEFAGKIAVSVRHLSRLETNQANVDISVLVGILRVFDKTMDDFGAMFLDSKEYGQHKEFLTLRSFFSTRRWDDYDEFLSSIDSRLEIAPEMQQLIALATIIRRIEASDDYFSFTKDDLKILHDAMCISQENFDEDKVSEYLLTRMDVDIIHTVCHAYLAFKEFDRAVKLAQAVLDNKSIVARYAENKGDFAYIQALLYLISCYAHSGRNADATLLLLQTYRKLMDDEIPIRNIGFCTSELGFLYAKKGEDKSLAKSYLTRGYHWYVMEGLSFKADNIKEDAKKLYNIDIEI
ncbi:MAG: helix-turn-helix transcriptional regulator [Firmicutes bacterium]|nr:helix-turn-helix transcriptional regulator [Bacillota bacterium]